MCAPIATAEDGRGNMMAPSNYGPCMYTVTASTYELPGRLGISVNIGPQGGGRDKQAHVCGQHILML